MGADRSVDSFWGNIFSRRNDREKALHEVLATIPLFEGLRKSELERVARLLYERRYSAGEAVFHQGEPGVGMYIILEGRVEVIFEPTGQVLAELKAGEFFGEMSLVDESPRAATVAALTDSRMMGLFLSDLTDLIDRNPRLGVKILQRLVHVVASRLRRSNEQLSQMREELRSLSAHDSMADED